MSEQRLLRSRAARGALFYENDGRCGRCGGPLEAGWHAHHRVPWRVRPITNPHQMQATCPRCNLAMGSKENE